MTSLRWLGCSLLLILTMHQAATALRAEEQPEGCRWKGPSPEWVLARHPRGGAISGTLGDKIVPFLGDSGIPISLITKVDSDESVSLKIGPETTTLDVLDQIESQVPGYQYKVVYGRIVIYPKGQGYDAPVVLGKMSGATRAAALISLLRELRPKVSLEMSGFRGSGERTYYGDTVEVGGDRTLIEHLVSLLQKRPDLVFSVVGDTRGRRFFVYHSVSLVQSVKVEVPPEVAVGSVFQAIVKAVLTDGSVVSLEGPECYVEYKASGHGELEIDDLGRVVARKKGPAAVVVRYEGQSNLAKVEVY
jgi:hypothetical protein